METNKINDPNYTQLCVLPGVTLKSSSPEEFESLIMENFDCRVKFHDEVITTQGNHEIFFYVHTDDISKFAVPRLKAGIRWWEDVVKYNDNGYLYTQEFRDAHPTTW